MTTKEIGIRLADLCRKADFTTAQKELYAKDAVSIALPGVTPREVKGLEAIIEKGHIFFSGLDEMKITHVSEPLISGNCIALAMTMDFTVKGNGRRVIDEICVYQVSDGKIISEQFFV